MPLFTRPFVLLCLAMFLGYANQWIFMPTIPLYVDALGGSAFVAGLAILAFSVPSFTARPFVGRLADRWKATGVMAIGLSLLAAGSLLLLVPFLAMVFVAGVVRGLGWAGTNIGGYTTLATVAPPERRGEAAGYYTSATASASVAFPALALWIIDGHGGFPTVFLVSALMALAGLPIALVLARERAAARSAAGAAEDPGWSGLIDRGVLLATGLNLCSTLAMPSVMAFLPLYARALDIDHIGYFYILAGATSILIRPVLGPISAFMQGGHTGIDLADDLGSPMVASDDGVVRAAGWVTHGGYRVCLTHASALETCYFHTSGILVSVGQRVRRGEAIALVGMSGLAGGPHVHWEARFLGRLTDPLLR